MTDHTPELLECGLGPHCLGDERCPRWWNHDRKLDGLGSPVPDRNAPVHDRINDLSEEVRALKAEREKLIERVAELEGVPSTLEGSVLTIAGEPFSRPSYDLGKEHERQRLTTPPDDGWTGRDVILVVWGAKKESERLIAILNFFEGEARVAHGEEVLGSSEYFAAGTELDLIFSIRKEAGWEINQ